MNKMLDELVSAGLLTSYSYEELDDSKVQNEELTLVFPGDKILVITAECGSRSDSDAWLIIGPKE